MREAMAVPPREHDCTKPISGVLHQPREPFAARLEEGGGAHVQRFHAVGSVRAAGCSAQVQGWTLAKLQGAGGSRLGASCGQLLGACGAGPWAPTARPHIQPGPRGRVTSPPKRLRAESPTHPAPLPALCWAFSPRIVRWWLGPRALPWPRYVAAPLALQRTDRTNGRAAGWIRFRCAPTSRASWVGRAGI